MFLALAVAVVTACPTAVDRDEIHYLDPDHRSLVQPLAGEIENAAKVKFVQVEVVEVVNPRRIALVFELHYEREGEQPLHLGDFTLYPADRPGRFIIPTQGKLKPAGAVVLTMTSPEKIERGDPVRASVKRLRFLQR